MIRNFARASSKRIRCFFLPKKAGFSGIEDMLVLLAGIVVFILMLLTTADVTGRYVFLHPLKGTLEISEIALVFMVWLSVAGTQRVGGHIGMEAIVELFKRRKSRAYYWLESFNVLPALLVFALTAYVFFKDTFVSYVMFEATYGPMFIKYWPFKLGIAIGCLALCVRFGIQLAENIRLSGVSQSLRLKGD